MLQFLGIWYAIQKTSTASSCVIYNITLGEEPGEYKIEQTSQHFVLKLTPFLHEYSYTGQLSIPDQDVPAKMRVRFPLSKYTPLIWQFKLKLKIFILFIFNNYYNIDVAGDSSFTIFMTDYTNFAGIFTCQKVTFAHRQSATLLSRTRTLDKIYVDKVCISYIYKILSIF